MTSRSSPVGRVMRWIALSLGGLLLLLVGTVSVAVMLLDTSAGRNQVQARVNALLAEQLQGRVVIERIQSVGLFALAGVEARVWDPEGRQVLWVSGLEVGYSVPGLLRDLLFGSELKIVLGRVSSQHIEVALFETPLGPSLASAFSPKPVTEQAAEPSAPIHLRVASIELDHVWVHGQLGGSPQIDAELRDVSARFGLVNDVLSLQLEDGWLLARGLPERVDPNGKLKAELELPLASEDALRAQLDFVGSAFEGPVRLHAALTGEQLGARLDAGPLPAEALNARWPGLALRSETRLLAEANGPLSLLDVGFQLDNVALTLGGNAQIDSRDGLALTVEAEAANLDGSGLVQQAPPSNLDAHLAFKLRQVADGGLDCEQQIVIEPGRVFDQTTPRLTQSGRVWLDERQRLRASGKLRAEEPGIEAVAEYEVNVDQERGPDGEVSLQVTLREPPRLAKLGVSTSGNVQLVAKIEPQGRGVSAAVQAALDAVTVQDLVARDVELTSTVTGTLEQPKLQAQLRFAAAAGQVQADLSATERAQRLELHAKRLSLRELRDAFGVELPEGVNIDAETARLEVDAKVRRVGERLAGSVEVAVADVQLRNSGRGRLKTRAALEDDRLNLQVSGAWDKLGKVDLKLEDVAPAGGRLTQFEQLTRWQTLQGRLTASGDVQLESLDTLLRAAVPELDQASGRLTFRVEAARLKADDVELEASVKTRGLRLTQKRQAKPDIDDTKTAVENEPLSLEGIDVELTLLGRLPEAELHTRLKLSDTSGALASLQGKAKLPGELLQGRASAGEWRQLPLEAELTVFERTLSRLPPLIRPSLMRGAIEGGATFSGTLANPELKVRVLGRRLQAERSEKRVDLALVSELDPRGGKFALTASERSQRVAMIDAYWDGDLRELGAAGERVLAQAQIHLDDFPVDVLPFVKARHVEGKIDARLEVRDWGRDAKVSARIDSNSLVVSGVDLDQVSVQASNGEQRLEAKTTVQLGGQKSEAWVQTGMRWGARWIPEFEPDLHAKVQTRSFELAALSPLLGGQVSELGGKVDADAELRLSQSGTQLDGEVELREGVLQLPAIGQRFTDIKGQLSISERALRLQSLSARGLTGRVTAAGDAQIDGTELARAELKVRIAEDEKLPLTVEGAAVGDAWGEVDLAYRGVRDGVALVNVDVRSFGLITPEGGEQGLQSLEDAPNIRVGTRNESGEFVSLPIQPLEPEQSESGPEQEPTPVLVTVQIRNARVERANTASARLRGDLQLKLERETRIEGRIELAGGQIDVQGKRFEIEQGVITFDGESPPNPSISAIARWDSPTDHAVYAEYVGDVENGRIKLRSEPPLTDDEIASLLLFGNTDGTFGSGGEADQAALAVSVAGSTVSKGLNQVLSDFSTLDVSTRVDTSTGSSRPEVVIQVTPRLAAKVSRAIGEPTPGESPDRTFLTLEFRLKRAWALSAVVGDRGASALDLIWRRRY